MPADLGGGGQCPWEGAGGGKELWWSSLQLLRVLVLTTGRGRGISDLSCQEVGSRALAGLRRVW